MTDEATPAAGHEQLADVLNCLRILLSRVQSAEEGSVRLEAGDPLVAAARELVEGDAQSVSRTATMLLRDLAWQVDMFKELVRSGAEPKAVIDLLDTAEVHAFLNEASARRRDTANG